MIRRRSERRGRGQRWITLGVISGFTMMALGCASIETQKSAAEVPPAPPPAATPESPAPAPTPAPAPPAQAAPVPPAPVKPTPEPKPAQAPVPAPESRTVTLNFDNADVPTVVRTLARLLGISYILEPTVGPGRVTIYTTGRFAKEELFPILETVLEANNLAITKAGPLYRIGPLAEARQRPLEAYVGREALASGDRIIVQVIPLNFLPASAMEGVLRPLVSKTGAFLPVPGTNSLVVVDLASNVKKLLEVVGILDVNTFERIQVKLYPVKHVDAEELAKDLEDLFAQLGYGRTAREPLRFLPVARLGAILVVNPFGELGPSIERWIQNLDQPATQPDQGIFVYYVENGKAANIADILNSLFQKERPPEARPARPPTPARAPGAAPSQPGAPPTPLTPAAPPGIQPGVREPGIREPAAPQPAAPGAPAAPARAPSAAPSVAPSGEIRIFADESTNALIIAAPPRQYPIILETIKQLDIPKKQVLIETLVAELTLDDTTKFGLEWSLRTSGRVNIAGKNFFVTSTPTANFGTLFTPQPSLLGFTSVITATDQILGLIQALSDANRVNVLSSPNILATDNKTAVINIGDSVPILTSQTNTAAISGGTPNVTNTIQYQDTGIILTVTAHITEKRMVVIDVKQEVSNISPQKIEGISSPIIQKRTATTSAVVADGQTVLIGGLISEERSQIQTGIPLLSKIPVLGYLFGATTDRMNKRELIILITPRVIGDPEDARGITSQFEERVKGLQRQLRQLRKEN